MRLRIARNELRRRRVVVCSIAGLATLASIFLLVSCRFDEDCSGGGTHPTYGTYTITSAPKDSLLGGTVEVTEEGVTIRYVEDGATVTVIYAFEPR